MAQLKDLLVNGPSRFVGQISWDGTASGSISGNAATATKLATARSLTTKLDSTTAVTFDGSADQNTIPITGTLGIANGGTGASTAAGARENLEVLRYINTTDNTTWTADTLGATTSIAFTRDNITGAHATGHIVWLNANDIGTPFQLVVHDSSELYLYKRWKSSGTWGAWTKMNAGYADSAGSLNNQVRTFGTISYGTTESGTTVDNETNRKAFIKYICDHYSNAALHIGTYQPNSKGPCIGNIYDVSDISNGYPRYSTFLYHNLGSGLVSFGTNDYNYYERTYVYNSGTWGISITGNAATATTLSTSGTAAKFWRGDNTWSDTISGGTLKITANSNTVTIGSQNTGFCHIYNSANIAFILNNSLYTTAGSLGHPTYPWNNLYLGKANGAGIYYTGTKNTYRMIRFIDNTTDTYGNGISIGGGGQTIIGGGESADTMAASAGTAGAEIMWVGNDSDINFHSNLQDGWDYKKTWTMANNGTLTVPGPIAYGVSGMDRAILYYNSSNPSYGIWYKDAGTDTMRFSASGNANTDAGADLCINGNGAGTVTIRGNTILHAGNYTNWAAQKVHTHDEASISFGHNTSYSGGTTIFGALYNDKLRGNRLAGFKPAGVTIEYSTNSGSSWTTYTVADSVKKALFTQGSSLRVVPSGINMTSGCWLRITLDTSAGQVYTFLTKFLINVTTYYSSNCRVTIDAATNGSPTNFSHVICTDRALSGWSGWNDIGCGFTTYGNQSSHYQKIRFVFKQDGTASGYASYGFTILNIRAYGGAGWTVPSYLAENDAPYVYNEEGDITCQRYLTATGVYGAVWNDYAEYRKDNPNENQEPGKCVKELGDGSLALTTKRLERGCEIVSDTFGFAIGQDEENGYNTPIASNGRVLAYPYESIEEFANHIGWPVCSGPNGTVSIMTEEEEEKYPSRIIGTISEIPTYQTWGTGNVEIDGRIWIRIK